MNRDSWRQSYFSGEPLRIGNEVQLLIDDYLVEDRLELKRVIGPLTKHPGNPLNTGPTLPWEARARTAENPKKSPCGQPIWLTDVVFDPEEKVYKAWYDFLKPRGRLEKFQSRTSYAESKDGLTWYKPELNLFSYEGRDSKNIVLYLEGDTACLKSVRLEADASDPNKRFRGIALTVPPGETNHEEENRCVVGMFSSDGRKWEFAPDPILFRGATDGKYCLVHDKRRDLWLLYRRPPSRAGARGMPVIDKRQTTGANSKRRVAVSVSEDFKTWTHPRAIPLPDEADISQADVDSVTVVQYRNVFFGFIGVMDNPTRCPKQTHLMFSRDGFRWERLPDRPVFVPNGSPGEWDAGWVHVSSIVPDGDMIRIYYHGMNVAQGEKRLPRVGGTGIAWIGKDRFIEPVR